MLSWVAKIETTSSCLLSLLLLSNVSHLRQEHLKLILGSQIETVMRQSDRASLSCLA